METNQSATSVFDEVKTLQTAVNTRVENIDGRVADIEAQMLSPNHRGTRTPTTNPDSPGSRLTKATGFLEAAKMHGRARFEIGRLWPDGEQKTIISSSSLGSSTPGILVPDRVSPIVPLARRKVRIRDLMRARTTTSSAVEFIRETGFTNAASPQVEGSAKSESTNTFAIASAPVRTIAHWIPMTRQALDDLPELSRFINTNLLHGLLVKEEDEILAGDGTGEHLSGLLTQATAYAGTYNASGDNKLDTIRHAILELQNGNEYPDGIVLSPKDFHDIQLIKDESGGVNKGSYLAGDPLGGVIEVTTLWGLNLVVSHAITAGTFLLGNFSEGAGIFDRLNAVIDISTEHSDYFVRNLVAVRAEERVALAVFRATAFLTGTF